MTFQQADLNTDPIPPCDSALVRNVWRHLTPTGQATLAAHLHTALPPHGWLLLGGGNLMNADLVNVVPNGLANHFSESAHHPMI